MVNNNDTYYLPTYLYKLYNKDNKLLYIGITTNYRIRFRQHQKKSFWWPQVNRCWIKKYYSRTLATKAEKKLIHNQKPIHNVVYNY